MKFSSDSCVSWTNCFVFLAASVGALLLACLTASPTAAAKPAVSKTLLYEVLTDPQTTSTPKMDLLMAIDSRLDSVKTCRVKVQFVERNRVAVEVVVSDSEKLSEAIIAVERRLAFLGGSLEFRIVANRRDHQALITKADTETKIDRLLGEHGEPLAWWTPLAPGVDPKPYQHDKDILVRHRNIGKEDITQVLVVNDPYNVTGKYVPTARPGVNDKGNPTVDLTFDEEGGQLLGRLTSANLPDNKTGFRRRLGVLIDGNLYTAPYIQGRITNYAQVTGHFTQSEVVDLCSILNSETLPMRLKRVSGN